MTQPTNPLPAKVPVAWDNPDKANSAEIAGAGASDKCLNQIKSCPFCGQGSTYRCDYRGGEWAHDSKGCFLDGVYIAGQHSIEQWNTRPTVFDTETNLQEKLAGCGDGQ